MARHFPENHTYKMCKPRKATCCTSESSHQPYCTSPVFSLFRLRKHSHVLDPQDSSSAPNHPRQQFLSNVLGHVWDVIMSRDCVMFRIQYFNPYRFLKAHFWCGGGGHEVVYFVAGHLEISPYLPATPTSRSYRVSRDKTHPCSPKRVQNTRYVHM